MPETTVYREKLASMAAIAASLMCRGVAKCGSPAPKSTSFAPSARSLAAAAVTAMVAEISMRPMRWLNFVAVDGDALERVAEALMPSSLQGVRRGGVALRECRYWKNERSC